MMQTPSDNPQSPQKTYMNLSPAPFDYMEEQFGGGLQYEMPPVELTPSQLRTKLKATSRDVGLVKGASLRHQAHQEPSAVAQGAHSGTLGFPHVAQDGTAASKTSSLTLNVANSHHTSLFPTAQGPAQLDDIFYGTMNQQPGWIDPNSSDAFGMIGAKSFTGNILNDHSLGQSLGMAGVHDKSVWAAQSSKGPDVPGGSQHLSMQDISCLAPPPSFHFPPSLSTQPMVPHTCSLESTGKSPSGFLQNFLGDMSSFILQPALTSVP
ncbi:hypothetical protein F4604DRAFT_1918026 [Suillus subluteus]|nr:hypothetical protein F4604DRAFT_1918026 [Suillus subluteus]